MYNFKTKNLKYNMHNLICIASARVIASIDQFDLVIWTISVECKAKIFCKHQRDDQALTINYL